MVASVDPAGLVGLVCPCSPPSAGFSSARRPSNTKASPSPASTSTRSSQPLTRDQLLAMIPLQVGQPLLASDVRDSIQRLYPTGEYADIAVDATLAPRGVNLKFITKPTYFIGNVAVKASRTTQQGQLRVATKLQLGTRLHARGYEPGGGTHHRGAQAKRLLSAPISSRITEEQATTQQVHDRFQRRPRQSREIRRAAGYRRSVLRTEGQLIRSSGWKRFRRAVWRLEAAHREPPPERH